MGKRKPALRFKGFEGEWGRWQISNIADKTYGGGTPSTSNEEFWVGDIPWIQSSDLKEGKVFDVIPHKFLSKNAFNSSATKLIPENSIAIITRVGVGKLALIPFSYATSQDFLSLSNTNKNEWFTVYALYNKLKSEVNLVQGTSIKGITKQDFLSKEISVPCYDEEAIKIGNYFKQLDALITQQQRKYESLLNVKKSMLEKMFPKDGADVPEIRFKGFEGKWGKTNAEGIFYTTSDKNHPELPVLSASQEYGMIKRDESGINISHDKQNETTYKRVIPGQFVIHLRSFQGGFAHSKVEGITSPAYTILDFLEKEKHYDYFWKDIFTSKEFIKRLETVTYGIRDGRSISYNDFLMMSFTYPTFEEQYKIGTFFKHLDTLLTQHQKKLDHLTHIKTALLEKMFVSEAA